MPQAERKPLNGIHVLKVVKAVSAVWGWRARVRGSNPAEAVGIFQGEKILSTPSFGREVKSRVPCRRFAACKRSLNWRGSRNLRQNYRLILTHIVPPFATRISRVIVDVGVPGGERGNVQTGGGGQGEYNKPTRLHTSLALATGPTDEEEEGRWSNFGWGFWTC